MLSPKTPLSSKVQYLFDAFSGKYVDDVMTSDELFFYFKTTMNGGSSLISTKIIQKVADSVMQQFGRPDPVNKRIVIDFNKFSMAIDEEGVQAKMTVHY